jgi:hypothetical protein
MKGNSGSLIINAPAYIDKLFREHGFLVLIQVAQARAEYVQGGGIDLERLMILGGRVVLEKDGTVRAPMTNDFVPLSSSKLVRPWDDKYYEGRFMKGFSLISLPAADSKCNKCGKGWTTVFELAGKKSPVLHQGDYYHAGCLGDSDDENTVKETIIERLEKICKSTFSSDQIWYEKDPLQKDTYLVGTQYGFIEVCFAYGELGPWVNLTDNYTQKILTRGHNCSSDCEAALFLKMCIPR